MEEQYYISIKEKLLKGKVKYMIKQEIMQKIEIKLKYIMKLENY